MPKFQVELGYWNPFIASYEVEATDRHAACVQARLAFKPADWNPSEGDSQVFVQKIIQKGVVIPNRIKRGDRFVSVPFEDRESRVVMHMLADAVNAEDQEDGRG